ncbi:hypothetical protein N0603_05955 [Pseudomonas aeruginosa]|nr:hypothetical protein [Pseudomonas aeruginosa]MCT0513432.1 hypothetical protein [Pseudomonas aeruginosa]MCT0563118.1 hypothetical protein [Pseudomonas aeruginosa]MCT1034309.1 hypothetical protein [Pseudomonas aeruginosa]MCT1070200.1 hypothetical protein [Pseudomonas aeruginosa]
MEYAQGRLQISVINLSQYLGSSLTESSIYLLWQKSTYLGEPQRPHTLIEVSDPTLHQPGSGQFIDDARHYRSVDPYCFSQLTLARTLSKLSYGQQCGAIEQRNSIRQKRRLSNMPPYPSHRSKATGKTLS